MKTTDRQGEGPRLGPDADAARKRAAVETYVRNEAALRRTASRYSICADDADDALQRGLEILLRKAPTEDPRELIRWTQTVVKHEALAVRRERERILAGPAGAPPREEGAEDWVALLPAPGAGPAERAERHEAVARSREALQALKPQELRALTLLAEGYSYAEIGEITGYSRTKINRCLAEGRERFRKIVSRSEDGQRCADMRPAISAFCDGEASAAEVETLREHLRACGRCRATLRAYRAAPGAAAALAPLPALDRSLLERAHDALGGLAARFGAGGADAGLPQVASGGGARGLGVAALAKIAAICAGAAGGAACVATGLVPAPLGIGPGDHQARRPAHVRPVAPRAASDEAPLESSAEPPAEAPQPHPGDRDVRGEQSPTPAPEPEPAPEPATEEAGAVEYVPPAPEPAPEPSSSPPPASSGSPAGEFGP